MDRATSQRLREDGSLNGAQIRDTIVALSQIWDQLGFDGTARTERLEQDAVFYRSVYTSVQNLTH
mgnify:CR=1 FL=1